MQGVPAGVGRDRGKIDDVLVSACTFRLSGMREGPGRGLAPVNKPRLYRRALHYPRKFFTQKVIASSLQ